MERRLAAILAGEVVGCSRHMGEDEAGTYWVRVIDGLGIRLGDEKIGAC